MNIMYSFYTGLLIYGMELKAQIEKLKLLRSEYSVVYL